MRADDSRGGFSDAPRRVGADADAGAGDGDAEVGPLAVPELDRYEALDLVGAGGMGTVEAVLDHRLGREVARKTVTAAVGDADGAARLAREAWITARLEHPGIVPVLDAGTLPDGRPFYTMRLVRGRTLAAALADESTAPARLSLLRHYLAACHAIAYAHAQGVVHRDLKPANIMVGEHGETVVVDWGLAGPVDDAADAAAGGGTPRYMSPARAAGAAAGWVDDVWALGVVLVELALGRSPTAAEVRDPDGVLAAAGVPGELRAIAARALAADPAARYRDAGALAADVEAYLDGRRVAAHAYTPVELLARLARAWRGPLIVGALGLVAAIAVFAVTWRRVVAERTRAVAAEATTRDALAVAQARLAAALEGHARVAFEAGAWPEAEVIAARALALRESPDARGVLAAAHAGARPVAAAHQPVPGCARVVAAAGALAACSDGERLSLRELPSGRARWERPLRALDAAVLPDGGLAVLAAPLGVHVLDAASGATRASHPGASPAGGLGISRDGRWVVAITGGHDVIALDAARGARRELGRVCAPAPPQAVAVAPTWIVVACGDARVWVAPLDGAGGSAPRWIAAPGLAGGRAAMSAVVLDDDRTAVLGAVDGSAWVIDTVTGAVAPPVAVTRGSAERLIALGARVVVVPDVGHAALWDPARGAELLRLPSGATRRLGRDGDDVIAVGDGVWRWRPPTAPAPRTLVAPAGLSGGEVSPDGQWLAVARGDGRVTVWDRATGDVVAELPISSAVIKRVAFSPDGARLAVAVAGPEGVVELDVAGWRARAIEPTVASRRVFYLPDGGLIGAPYGPGLDHWDGRGRRRHLDVPQALDVHVAPGGDVVWMLSRDDRLRSWRDGTLADVAPARGAHALGASADGATVALASTDGVRVLRRRGDGAALDERWLDGGAGEVSEVIVARDGAWVAAGTLTGVVEVWRVADGALVARLRGHRGRNGALALGPRGALITTGWDGAAVAWDLDVLARPAAALAASAAAAWGEGLVVDDVR